MNSQGIQRNGIPLDFLGTSLKFLGNSPGFIGIPQNSLGVPQDSPKFLGNSLEIPCEFLGNSSSLNSLVVTPRIIFLITVDKCDFLSVICLLLSSIPKYSFCWSKQLYITIVNPSTVGISKWCVQNLKLFQFLCNGKFYRCAEFSYEPTL